MGETTSNSETRADGTRTIGTGEIERKSESRGRGSWRSSVRQRGKSWVIISELYVYFDLQKGKHYTINDGLGNY